MVTLESLVTFSKPIEEISNNLSKLNWDFEGEAFAIKSVQIINVLQRYISGDICAKEIENWANLIECREDVKFEENKAEELDKTIFQLANPALEGEISPDMCSELIYSLS
ncbi:hypothetical protein [Kiloniella sp.]|uniref:hypothetical protein n=1 Tax=Kiloniella sp. TaxID=1938587 RepID=UPI003B011A1C